MTITVLVDNYTYIDKYLLGEPGFSAYVECGGDRILFDTGYSDVVVRNAAEMGIDIGGCNRIVLSHGHNDHTGGLKYIAERFDLSKKELIYHPLCFAEKYKEGDYIGAPFTEKKIAQMTQCTAVKTPYFLSKNCVFLGEIPQKVDFESRYALGKTNRGGIMVEDYLYDDSALAFNTPEGIVILAGCAHSGICNIIEYARENLQNDRVAAVIGGFHLSEVNDRLKNTVAYMKKIGVGVVYPCHCVSLAAKFEMAKSLRIGEVGVGFKFSI